MIQKRKLLSGAFASAVAVTVGACSSSSNHSSTSPTTGRCRCGGVFWLLVKQRVRFVDRLPGDRRPDQGWDGVHLLRFVRSGDRAHH